MFGPCLEPLLEKIFMVIGSIIPPLKGNIRAFPAEECSLSIKNSLKSKRMLDKIEQSIHKQLKNPHTLNLDVLDEYKRTIQWLKKQI